METTKKDTSLIGCMMDVPDPRAPYNQRHKFIDIITIAIMAVICGMDTWNEIEDWARSKKEWLGTFLELPGEIPSHDTINRVFQMLDSEQFHRAFFPQTSAIVGKVQGVVAIDGKTVRRSREEASGLRPIHVVKQELSRLGRVQQDWGMYLKDNGKRKGNRNRKLFNLQR